MVAGRPLNPWDVVIYRELQQLGIHTTILGRVNEDGGVPTQATVTMRDILPGPRLELMARLRVMTHAVVQTHGVGFLPSPIGFDEATVGLRAMLRNFDAVVAIETHRASTYQACSSGTPTLVRVSENIPNNPPQFPGRWFRNAVESQAAGFACQTESAAAALRAEGVDSGKIVVIPETVDTDVFRPPSGPREPHPDPVVGFAGKLEPQHGVLDLVDAFARITKRTDAVLRIAGEGRLAPALQSRIFQLGIAGRASLVGKLSYREMPDFLRDIDVLCMPYRETPEWKPQFGVVNLEAMACGTPTLTTATGGIPEILPPGLRQIAVPPGDVHALEERLRALVTDSTLREELGLEAREWVLSRFDTKVCAPRWVRLLRSLGDAAWSASARGRPRRTSNRARDETQRPNTSTHLPDP